MTTMSVKARSVKAWALRGRTAVGRWLGKASASVESAAAASPLSTTTGSAVAAPLFTMDAALARTRQFGFPVASVIDIGAAQGSWTRTAVPHFPGAKFLLMEPLHERLADLERLCADVPNCDYVLAAAGACAGEVPLSVAPDLDGSGVYPSHHLRTVKLTTVDAEAAARNLPGPFLLKFDTHGYEIPILQGAARTLQDTSVIVMEVYNFRFSETCLRLHEMIAHLESLGFRCFDAADPMLRMRDGALWQMDLFFARSDHPLFAHEGWV